MTYSENQEPPIEVSEEKEDVKEEEDGEEEIEEFKQDIPNNLRHILEESREVSYEEYGEKKVVSVKHGEKTCKFYKDHARQGSGWVMETEGQNGEYIDTINLDEEADVEYLEKLFEQDITENLRRVLEESREVSYEEYGEKKVVSAKNGERTYKFYRDSGREYSEWAMDIYDKNDKFVDSVDVREASDVKYLEKLFETPTDAEKIKDITEKIQDM